MRMSTRFALAACLAALAGATPAAAQQPAAGTPPAADRPWAEGVSEENQKIALEAFREGNALLKESLFVRAAEKYREALKAWDHPAIHYNLALALLNLDQPVEVYLNLIESMRYGAAPLDTEKYENAGRFKTLIEQQLARVRLTCDVQGARVAFDGKDVLAGPGRWESVVRAGPHTIVASAEGYVTSNLTPNLPAGKETALDVQLFTAEALTKYRRRWADWKPWAVTAGGVAVVALGGVLHWRAASAYSWFDDQVLACGGCEASGDMVSRRDRGDLMQGMAVVSYAVGGLGLAAGAVLVYMNRARPYQEMPAQQQPAPGGNVAVTPVVGPTGGGVQATFRF